MKLTIAFLLVCCQFGVYGQTDTTVSKSQRLLGAINEIASVTGEYMSELPSPKQVIEREEIATVRKNTKQFYNEELEPAIQQASAYANKQVRAIADYFCRIRE